MANPAMSLSYPVRLGVLAVFFGQFCLVLAALALAPFAVSLLYGEAHLGLRYLAVSALCAGLGAGLSRLSRPRRVQTNEAMVLVAAMFIFSPLIMAWPIMGSGLGFADALFEAVSGVTTTGLTTVRDAAQMPRTFLFGRAWMQWYGGLGVAVLTLAFVLPPGAAARRLSLGDGEEEDLVGGTKLRARRLSLVYAALTLLGVAGLWAAGLTPFSAAAYAMAAVSTGGFAPADTSLAGLGLAAQGLVTLLCLAGAVPLALYYQLYAAPHRAATHWGQTLALLILAAMASAGLALVLGREGGLDWGLAWREGALTAFSAQTTAGFSSTAPAVMPPAALAVIMAAMFVGGGVGSTAGGIKVLRLLVFLKVFGHVLSRTALAPDAVSRPRLMGMVLEDRVVREALFITALAAALIGLSWLPFLALGHDPMASLFEVVSAVGTVGLSAGVTSSELHPLLKGVLCADMLMGRLEMVAFLVILYPRTWMGRRLALK